MHDLLLNMLKIISLPYIVSNCSVIMFPISLVYYYWPVAYGQSLFWGVISILIVLHSVCKYIKYNKYSHVIVHYIIKAGD